MIYTSLFRKYFLILSAIFIFIVIASFASIFIFNQSEHNRAKKSGPLFFVKLIDRAADPFSEVRELNQLDKDFPMQFDLVDSSGMSLILHPGVKLPYSVPSLLNQDSGPFGPRLFRLRDPKKPYLLIIHDSQRPGHHNNDMLIVNLITLLVSIFLASFVAVFFLYYSFRDKALTAQKIFHELKSGHLKARLPISKIDEVGRLMQLFNQMADEFERLITQLRDQERARVNLLQELAHDLRTPIASLKTLTETLKAGEGKLTVAIREEFLSLQMQELSYFEKLVEDLLFLAQVLEPNYRLSSEEIVVTSLIEETLARVKVRYPQIEARVLLSSDTSSTRVLGSGQLLSRALRNALENAFSFATSKITIEIRHERSFIIIDILDDGPGLSEEQLNQFGKKRISRSVQRQQKQNRISVGLGSVIMAQVSTLHGGTVEIINMKVQDQVIGAQLTFTLPRFIYS